MGWDDANASYVLRGGGTEVSGPELVGALFGEWLDAYRLANGEDPPDVLELRMQILTGLAPPTEL